MNEELKKYVQAYLDGEEVEYQYSPNTLTRNYNWYPIDGLGTFDMKPEDTKFRIKPKAEDKWQRVIGEGYLCKFWDTDTTNTNLSILKAYDTESVSYPFQDDTTEKYAHCEVLRKQGYIQPYFQGDKIPEIKGTIFIYYNNEYTKRINRYYSQGKLVPDWEYVSAYIEV